MASPAEIRRNDNKKTKLEEAQAVEDHNKRVGEHNRAELQAQRDKNKADKEEGDRRRDEKQLAKEKEENSRLKIKQKKREKFLQKDLSPENMAEYRQLVIMANSTRTPDRESMNTLGDYRTRLGNNGFKWKDYEAKLAK